ncbi:MAG: CDP-glucose 4,6-dehydratase [Chitinophagaceae bacterium]|nr:CDP-glucose 4,6-dehydratase [Chitinophagaceae bacterium]
MTNIFKDKVVLVTGHTGFKGTWLTTWLLELGAKVVGLSIDIPSTPSNFVALNLENRISHNIGDIRDITICKNIILNTLPDFIFHLAAQPIVTKSYQDPIFTFETNIIGTLNMLEALRISNHNCNAVFITSDKCYDNVEQVWGYKENDKVGGKDPYSASKGGAELVIRSYVESFFKDENSKVKIAVARAGNVIGGGDWALDRIVPDIFRAWANQNKVYIRNKYATRPWQHVLEPLSGYLLLAKELSILNLNNGEAFNFGPNADQNYSVEEILYMFKQNINDLKWDEDKSSIQKYEAKLLKLCCDKALHYLNWKPSLSINENIKMTANWYSTYYEGNIDMYQFTVSQIKYYIDLSQKIGNTWI